MTGLAARLAALRERVRDAVSHVSLFPLVRTLERELAVDAPVGSDVAADLERIHFTHPPDFAFPAGEVADLAVHTEGNRTVTTLTTTFFGLLGAESPLAASMSEAVLFEEEPGALAAFYDVFQHRAISLMYRAWKRYSIGGPMEGSGKEALGRALLSLVGIDAFASTSEPFAVEPMFALGLSDLARGEPSYLDTTALEHVLRRVFPELSPRVSQAEPHFVLTDPEDMSRLGAAHTTLGVDAGYGAGALDAAGVIRVVVGPVSRAIYEELMPGGERYRVMQPLIDEWLAERAIAELEVILPSEAAPHTRLGDEFGGTLGFDARYAASDPPSVRVRVRLLADTARAVRRFVE